MLHSCHTDRSFIALHMPKKLIRESKFWKNVSNTTENWRKVPTNKATNAYFEFLKDFVVKNYVIPNPQGEN